MMKSTPNLYDTVVHIFGQLSTRPQLCRVSVWCWLWRPYSWFVKVQKQWLLYPVHFNR
jgi:hypothetical protein